MNMEKPLGVYIRGVEHLTPEERQRLRRAEQICGQVSRDAGFDLDSLEQAAACVDFVHGSIDEVELWDKARAEIEQGLTP
jgi:hypothetical protein